MLHLSSFVGSSLLLTGGGTLLITLLGRERAVIARALRMEGSTPSAAPMPARVRLVAHSQLRTLAPARAA